MPPDRIFGWLNSACWTVSCISLQSAGSLLLCQEYRRTTRKCQRYSPKWLSTQWMMWQIITDFLKLLSDFERDIYIEIKKIDVLLSLFLTAYHYSSGVVFPAKDTKAGAIGSRKSGPPHSHRRDCARKETRTTRNVPVKRNCTWQWSARQPWMRLNMMFVQKTSVRFAVV